MHWGGMHFDCGGLKFSYDNPIIYYGKNYSVLAVARFNLYAIKGDVPSRRQVLVWPGGDTQMMWQDQNGYVYITVYDTDDSTWKQVGVDIGEFYNRLCIYYGYLKNSEEGIVVYDLDGNVLAENHIDNIISPITGERTVLCIGSNLLGNYRMNGDIFAAAIFEKILTDDEISALISSWMIGDTYKSIDGCNFACVFDRLRYGDTPYDIINNVYGTPVDPNKPPRWNLMLTKDVGLEVLE